MLDGIIEWLRSPFLDPKLTTVSAIQIVVLYVGSAVAIVTVSWRGIRMVFKWLWPPRPSQPGWAAQATPLREGETQLRTVNIDDANNAWRHDRINWTHAREMRKDDVYTLTFGKRLN